MSAFQQNMNHAKLCGKPMIKAIRADEISIETLLVARQKQSLMKPNARSDFFCIQLQPIEENQIA
jgi:hypothetical protein